MDCSLEKDSVSIVWSDRTFFSTLCIRVYIDAYSFSFNYWITICASMYIERRDLWNQNSLKIAIRNDYGKKFTWRIMMKIGFNGQAGKNGFFQICIDIPAFWFVIIVLFWSYLFLLRSGTMYHLIFWIFIICTSIFILCFSLNITIYCDFDLCYRWIGFVFYNITANQ